MKNKSYFFVGKIIYLILILSLWQINIYCQKSSNPVLLATLQDTGVELDISEYLYKVANNASGNFSDHRGKGLIAIRVCSPEPIQIAFFYAMGNPINNTERFRDLIDGLRYNSPPNPKTEVYFLRTNKNCKLGKQFTTQYWFVPEDADLPEFVEYRKFGEVDYYNVIFNNYQAKEEDPLFPFMINNELLNGERDTELNSKTFEFAKPQIAKLLKRNKTALLLIKTPDDLRRQKIINPRAAALKTFLNQQGIGNHRIFVRKCSWCFNSTYHTTSKDLYPEVSIFFQEPPQK